MMDKRPHYVLGFMFNINLTEVALIRKNRPAWQCGKLNGIGGHIEPGEDPATAMCREFTEEAGLDTGYLHWSLRLIMRDESRDGFVVYVYRYIKPVPHLTPYLTTTTDETVKIVKTARISRHECISNIPWMLNLLADLEPAGRSPYKIEAVVGGSGDLEASDGSMQREDGRERND